MGGASSKPKASDRTAAGLAKIRHCETIFPREAGEKRLFEDPYAAHFYRGSSLVAMLPLGYFLRNATNVNAGMMHLLAGRTREFDEQVLAAVAAGIRQVVILGAGYDTRGFRLGLASDVRVIELDQPDVQEKKRAALAGIAKLPKGENVHFLPIDFKVETPEKLHGVPGYDASAPTLFLMEGVTQYIPKSATAGTLKAVAAVCGPGSRFVASYVPQDLWDAPDRCCKNPEDAQTLFKEVAKVGEPWISGWSRDEFAALMREHGFAVQRDITLPELIEEYYVPAGRQVPEEQRIAFERYAWALKQ